MSNFVLTDQTVEVLKNFAKISPQISLKNGTFQRTCHDSRTFIADVELDTPIPSNCALFDLNRLLGIIETSKGAKYPIIDFGENSLRVIGEYSAVTLPYANPLVIAPIPEFKFTMVEPFAKFDLPHDKWTKIRKTAAILETPSLEFAIVESQFKFTLTNEKKNGGETLGNASFTLPNVMVEGTAPNNSWIVTLDTLELLSGDYDVVFGNMLSSSTNATNTKMFGAFFTLKNGPKISYITSGHVKK